MIDAEYEQDMLGVGIYSFTKILRLCWPVLGELN